MNRIVPAMISVLLTLALVGLLPAQDQPSEPVCPLTEDQTKKSIQAFAQLAPIFREPRCANCHGAIDPFKDGGGHGGDTVEATTDCSDCHDDFTGHWAMAPEPMFFVGKSDEALCKQMKDFFSRAKGQDSFIGHMTNDNNGPSHFIETGLAGTKGMKLAAGEKPEKPGDWNSAKLIRLSQAWVDAMGGRFHGDPSCGCSSQHYDLDLDYEVTIDLSGLPLVSGQYDTKTQGQNLSALEIPLTMTAFGRLEGEAVMTLQGHGSMHSLAGTCTGQSQQSFLVHAVGELEEGDESSRGKENTLHFQLTCKEVQEQSSGACPRGSGSQKGFTPCDTPVDVEFTPANVNAQEQQLFPVPLPNSKATLTSTITKDE